MAMVIGSGWVELDQRGKVFVDTVHRGKVAEIARESRVEVVVEAPKDIPSPGHLNLPMSGVNAALRPGNRRARDGDVRRDELNKWDRGVDRSANSMKFLSVSISRVEVDPIRETTWTGFLVGSSAVPPLLNPLSD